MPEVDKTKQYVGRRAKIGNLCQVDDKIGVFAGYTPCCRAKMIYSFDEVRELERRFSGRKKNRVKKRIADVLIPVLQD